MSYGRDEECVYLDFEAVVRETDGARLLDLGDRQAWVPKSSKVTICFSAEEQVIGVATWFAEKEGLT